MDLALSDIIEHAGSTNSPLVVMPTVAGELVILAVVELAPAAIGRGGDPSEQNSRWIPATSKREWQIGAGVTEEETGMTGSGPLLTVPFLLFAD